MSDKNEWEELKQFVHYYIASEAIINIDGLLENIDAKIDNYVQTEKQASKDEGRREELFLLLQRFNDYEVPLTMTAEDVREILKDELKDLENTLDK
jgi:C4-type Zn-finger protein